MRPIKMLGLAALAALMAMAFIGASSAMAESTALCKLDPGTGSSVVCPSGELVTHVHEVTLPGQPATLLSSIFDVECDALFLGDVISANNLGSPLEIEGTFTYENCSNNCVVTEENGPSFIDILKLGHELADVTGEGLVHVVCGIFINCRYDGAGLEGHALGPLLSSEPNGEVILHDQEVHKEGPGLCPEIGELDILTTPLKTHLETLMNEGVYITK